VNKEEEPEYFHEIDRVLKANEVDTREIHKLTSAYKNSDPACKLKRAFRDRLQDTLRHSVSRVLKCSFPGEKTANEAKEAKTKEAKDLATLILQGLTTEEVTRLLSTAKVSISSVLIAVGGAAAAAAAAATTEASSRAPAHVGVKSPLNRHINAEGTGTPPSRHCTPLGVSIDGEEAIESCYPLTPIIPFSPPRFPCPVFQ